MTRKISPSRRVQFPAVPVPHSSWTRAERADRRSARIVPDEFWARLGL